MVKKQDTGLLGSSSLVVGSPLTGSSDLSPSSIGSLKAKSSDPVPIKYLQPKGESSYKNSPRITLGPVVDKTEPLTVPVMVSWTHGGKQVFVTGTFNAWRKKIQLCKR